MKTIRGVEIFKAGTHKGRTYKAADLKQIVDNFSALDFKPPVKLGHIFRDTNQPEPMAAGWVDNLRLQGDTIVADLVDVPDEVYDAIRQRRYDNVSAEIAFNMERNGKTYDKALTALALLGINLPAVAGLKPLHKMFDFGFLKTVEAEAYSVDLPADSPQAIYIALPPGVTPEKMREAVAELSQDLTKQEIPMDPKEIEKVAADAAKKAAEEAEKRIRAEYDAKLEAERKAREESEKRLRDQQETYAAEQRERASREFADRCVVPALRPMLVVAHSLAAKAPSTETFDIGLQDEKKQPKKVGAVEALNALIDTVNAAASKKLFAVDTGKGGKPAERETTFDATDKKAVGAEVEKRVAERLAKPEHKDEKYEDALTAVLAADEQLKVAYAA